MQGKYPEALALLQELALKLPSANHSVQFQELLAEAANKAGNLALAQSTYSRLATELDTPQAAYFRTRAAELAAQISRGAAHE